MDCKVVQNYVITPIVLGQGCFGTVYRGYMKNNKNQLLAVKAIPLEKIKNQQIIKRQIEILLKLNSVNIVKFYKPAKTKNHLYFFLEYCQTDLKAYVKSKGGKLGQAEVIDIFKQICNGFKQVHEKNIIHRDIKPANFLMHNGVVKIADFGFARVVDSADEETILTFLGSPLYMAPQILAKQKFSSKCDVWSLGVTIYQILYGKPPYTAKSPPELLQNIKNKPLQFPDDIKRSDQIKDLLRKMLVIQQENRISWNQLFVHPVIKPVHEKIEKTEDALINSFRENQAYMKRTKAIGKVSQFLQETQEQIKSQKMEENKGTEGDFQTDLKMQEAKIKQYAKIQEIDEYMRYKRNVSVFLNVQCNNFFSVAGQKLPQMLFYMGLFILLKHQIAIHEQLQKTLCEDKPVTKFPPQIWPMYLKSTAHGRVLKLVQCDLKHLSSYFKEVKARVSKSIKGNKHNIEVVGVFEKNFLETDKFNPQAYTIVMTAILGELDKSGVKEANFITKLKISMDPFKYLDNSIDFGLFYERQNEQLTKIRQKFGNF